MACIASYIFDVTQRYKSSEEKCVPPHVTLYDETKVQFGCCYLETTRSLGSLVKGLPDWTFLGPNLQNLDHFNHVWTKKKLFGPFELKVWTFLRF